MFAEVCTRTSDLRRAEPVRGNQGISKPEFAEVPGRIKPYSFAKRLPIKG
jgi:hypothetical protein